MWFWQYKWTQLHFLLGRWKCSKAYRCYYTNNLQWWAILIWNVGSNGDLNARAQPDSKDNLALERITAKVIGIHIGRTIEFRQNFRCNLCRVKNMLSRMWQKVHCSAAGLLFKACLSIGIYVRNVCMSQKSAAIYRWGCFLLWLNALT